MVVDAVLRQAKQCADPRGAGDQAKVIRLTCGDLLWCELRAKAKRYGAICHRGTTRLDGGQVIHQHARNRIGLHVEIALAVKAVDLSQPGNGLAGDEIGQRHKPISGAHLEAIEGRQHPVFFGQADADLDLFIR